MDANADTRLMRPAVIDQHYMPTSPRYPFLPLWLPPFGLAAMLAAAKAGALASGDENSMLVQLSELTAAFLSLAAPFMAFIFVPVAMRLRREHEAYRSVSHGLALLASTTVLPMLLLFQMIRLATL